VKVLSVELKTGASVSGASFTIKVCLIVEVFHALSVAS